MHIMPASPDLPLFNFNVTVTCTGMAKGTVGERREGSKFTCAPGESGGGECGEDNPPRSLSCRLRPAGDATGLFAPLGRIIGWAVGRRCDSR
jgi:hypothetical protein